MHTENYKFKIFDKLKNKVVDGRTPIMDAQYKESPQRRNFDNYNKLPSKKPRKSALLPNTGNNIFRL